MTTAAISTRHHADALKMPISRPINRPNQAPLAAPASAARAVVRRPSTFSTILRSVPTMADCSTGNPLSDRKSTAR